MFRKLTIFCLLFNLLTVPAYSSIRDFYLNPEAPKDLGYPDLNSYNGTYLHHFNGSNSWRKPKHSFGYQTFVDLNYESTDGKSHLIQINLLQNMIEGHLTLSLYTLENSRPKFDFSYGVFSQNDEEGLMASFGPQLDSSVTEMVIEASEEVIKKYRKGLKTYFGEIPETLRSQFLMNKNSHVFTMRISQTQYKSILERLKKDFQISRKELTEEYFNSDFQADWRSMFKNLCQVPEKDCKAIEGALIDENPISLGKEYKFPSWFLYNYTVFFNSLTTFHQDFEFLDKLGPTPLKELSLVAMSNESMTSIESSKIKEIKYESGRKILVNDGTHFWLEVKSYRGQLKGNVPHGIGSIEFGDGIEKGGRRIEYGHTYLGEIKSGLSNGKGKLFNQFGHKVFEGEFKNGKKDGFGITFVNGNGLYGFTYKNGKISGGEYYSRNRNSIEKGKIVAGKKEGRRFPLPGLKVTNRGKLRIIGEKGIEVMENGGILVGNYGFPSNYDEITLNNPMFRSDQPIWFGKCKFLDVKGGTLEGNCDSNTGLIKKGEAKYTNANGQPQKVSIADDGSYSFTTWWEEEVEVEKAGFLRRAYDRVRNEVKRIPKNLKKNNIIRGALAVVSLGYSEYALGGIKDLWVKVAEKTAGETCEIAEVFGTEKKNCNFAGGGGSNSDGNPFLMDGDGNIALKSDKKHLNIESKDFDWNSAIKYSRNQELLEFLQMENSLDWYLDKGPLKNSEDFLALKSLSNNFLSNAESIISSSKLSEKERFGLAKDLILMSEKFREAGLGQITQETLINFVEEFFEKNSNFRGLSSTTLMGGTIGSLILPGPGTLVGALIGAGIAVWSIDQIYRAFNIAHNEDFNYPSKSVSKVDERAKIHILDGDKRGGGHRAGTGNPGKTEFPESWSDERIIEAIEEVSNDPSIKPTDGKWDSKIKSKNIDGVDVEVIIDKNGRIVTGYPTNVSINQ